VIGIILLIIIFSGILAPFTIAGGKHEQWKQAKILAPLIIGIFCIPVWLFWEKYSAKSTLIPFKVRLAEFNVIEILTIKTAVG
jgi:SIT family siderophore-iron:H+ symporter-like MFS transporter